MKNLGIINDRKSGDDLYEIEFIPAGTNAPVLAYVNASSRLDASNFLILNHMFGHQESVRRFKIENLYSFLKKSNADDIVVRTSCVMGGWHDNEFDANAAGYSICRFFDPEMEARHEFSQCYHFVKKN